MTAPHRQEGINEPDREEIGLMDILATIWNRRLKILLPTLAFALLCTLFLLPKITAPSGQETRMKFWVDFPGITQGLYPNGTAFSPEDVTLPQIVETVFEKNQLAGLGLTLPQFRNMLAITKDDDGLMFLEAKYRAMLGVRNLSPEERQLIQEEYQAKKDRLLDNNRYYIKLQDGQAKIPPEKKGKILKDILNEWARFSENRRGIYRYEIPVVTPEIFDLDMEQEEYIIQVDMLRRLANQIMDSIQSIGNIPGVHNMRLGAKTPSILTLKIRTENLLRYKILPLGGLIRNGQLYKNEHLTTIYLQEQIYSLTRTEQEQQRKLALIRDSLDGYMENMDSVIAAHNNTASPSTDITPSPGGTTIIPQIGDQFLDRLVSLTQINQDITYRQNIAQNMVEQGTTLIRTQSEINFYKDLLPGANVSIEKMEIPDIKDLFSRNFDKAGKTARQIAVDTDTVFREICRISLRPEQTFYTSAHLPQTTAFYVRDPKTLLAIAGILTVVFSLLVCVLTVLRERFSAL